MSRTCSYLLNSTLFWRRLEVSVCLAFLELFTAIPGVQPSTMLAMAYVICFSELDDLPPDVLSVDVESNENAVNEVDAPKTAKQPLDFDGQLQADERGVDVESKENAVNEVDALNTAEQSLDSDSRLQADEHEDGAFAFAHPRLAELPPSLADLLTYDFLHLPLFPDVRHPDHDQMLDDYVSSVYNLWLTKVADLENLCGGLCEQDYEKAGMLARYDAIMALRKSMKPSTGKVQEAVKVARDEASVAAQEMSGFNRVSTNHETNDITVAVMHGTGEMQNVCDVAGNDAESVECAVGEQDALITPHDGSAGDENGGASKMLADARLVLPPSIVEALAFDVENMHLFLPMFPQVGHPDRDIMLEFFFFSVRQNFQANLVKRKVADLDNRCAGLKNHDFEAAGRQARHEAIKVLRELPIPEFLLS
ncbi:hypothetical protein V1514DRAFT_343774 [Lipomyces japonicus]|uniref:uncharacterized protein n=1 Tax=Lipomyces japonicus TaxID=56871 RepID=UPI0034CF7793